MATNVLLPQWGMNMEDGLLVKWLVKEGDAVEADQPLVEIETAKIESELESPVSGVIAHIMAPEGSTVDVGTLVAVIAEPGETVPRPEITKPERSTGPRRSARGGGSAASDLAVQVTPVARRLARQNDVDLATVQGSGPNGRITENDVRQSIEPGDAGSKTPIQVVPRARHLAGQNGIDLSRVIGTGTNGRVTVADVENAIEALAAVTEVLPLHGMRKTIADRMMQSVQSTAPVTLMTEADVTDTVHLRQRLLSEWRSHRIRPLDLDLVVKATTASLREHPRLNAILVDDEIKLLKEVNVGVAMAVTDGLVVPVIRQADEKDLLSVAREIRALATRSRKGELSMDDMMDATFTVTSLAGYGIDVFTPIIDPPQVAILGVGRIVEKPSVVEGEVIVRSMMSLSLTFDHRALDGVPAGEFLQTLVGKLRDPAWMA